jgi:hypothetical protein
LGHALGHFDRLGKTGKCMLRMGEGHCPNKLILKIRVQRGFDFFDGSGDFRDFQS